MKHYDLSPDLAMSPTVGLLHAMIDYNYRRLLRLVEGTEELLDYRGPRGELNSIGQLIRHLTVVDLHWVYRLQSRQVPKAQIQRFGPMYDEDGKLPAVQGLTLTALLSEYEEVQEELKRLCRGLQDEDLERVVPFENGHSASIRWGIWHIADHSRHHYANIAHLKKVYRSETAEA